MLSSRRFALGTGYVKKTTIVCALVLLATAAAARAEKVWTGAQSTLWSNGANWQDGTPPHSGDSLRFDVPGPITTNNDMMGLSLSGLDIVSSMTLNGNPITVGGTIEFFGNNITVNVPITFTNDFVGFYHGTYVFTQALTVPGGTFYLDGSNTNLTFANVNESSRTSFNAINMDSLTMTGSFGLSGDFSFRDGTLNMTEADLAPGTTTATISGLQFNLATNGVIRRPLHIESRLIGGTMLFTPSASVPGTVPNANAIDLLRDVHLEAPLRMLGALSGSGNLTIDSGATLYLRAGNTYVGEIILASGGQLVTENNNTYPPAAPLWVQAGSRFDVGATIQNVANLGCNGTLALGPGAALHAGVVALSGCKLDLVIAPGTGSAPGGIPIIINDGGSPVSGTFDSLPEGSTIMVNGVARTLTYQGGDGNDVMLLPSSLQDMWWVGPAENGTGMSLIQHGDRLFAIVFAYDIAGNPTWYAMPGGTWDASRSSYEGPVYTPHGTPYFSYLASSLIVGNPLGTMTLHVDSDTQITMSYVINGVSGSKMLVREPFGPADGTRYGNYGEMWWGGASQNGWGIAILEQGPTIFPIWYTYDAAGHATWFAVPVGSFTATNHYEGKIYETTGSPWLGATYDPARLHATEAGTFVVDFAGDTATLTYSVDGHTATVPLVKEPF